MTRAERDYRLARFNQMAPFYGWALVMLASAVPIGVFMWLLQEFAGKDTNLNVSLVASVSVVANLAMGGALWKMERNKQGQSDELNRLRGRAEAAERAAGIMPSGRR